MKYRVLCLFISLILIYNSCSNIETGETLTIAVFPTNELLQVKDNSLFLGRADQERMEEKIILGTKYSLHKALNDSIINLIKSSDFYSNNLGDEIIGGELFCVSLGNNVNLEKVYLTNKDMGLIRELFALNKGRLEDGEPYKIQFEEDFCSLFWIGGAIEDTIEIPRDSI